MKIEPQQREVNALYSKLIKDIQVAMLTTGDAEGALSARPMMPLEMDAEGAFWFFISARSTKVEHLHRANLSFSDSSEATYVSLSGHGELHFERDRIERLWTPFAKPWFPDGPESSDLALLKFVPQTGEYWDAPGSTMVRMLAMGASVLAGKPVGLGEHQKIADLAAPEPMQWHD